VHAPHALATRRHTPHRHRHPGRGPRSFSPCVHGPPGAARRRARDPPRAHTPHRHRNTRDHAASTTPTPTHRPSEHTIRCSPTHACQPSAPHLSPHQTAQHIDPCTATAVAPRQMPCECALLRAARARPQQPDHHAAPRTHPKSTEAPRPPSQLAHRLSAHTVSGETQGGEGPCTRPSRGRLFAAPSPGRPLSLSPAAQRAPRGHARRPRSGVEGRRGRGGVTAGRPCCTPRPVEGLHSSRPRALVNAVSYGCAGWPVLSSSGHH